MVPKNTLTAPKEVLQMTCCKCWTNKPCSRKICSCLKAQLSCSKISNWTTLYTTLDEKSDGGDEDCAEEADEVGSADEQ